MSFRVLTAEFAHETNTFNRRKTDYDTFLAIRPISARTPSGSAATPIPRSPAFSIAAGR